MELATFRLLVCFLVYLCECEICLSVETLCDVFMSGHFCKTNIFISKGSPGELKVK